MNQSYLKQINNLRISKEYLIDANNFIVNKCETLGIDCDREHIMILEDLEILTIQLERLIRAIEFKEKIQN